MWPLTSLRTKCISAPRKFRSSPPKDFCNTIGTEPTCRSGRRMSVAGDQRTWLGRGSRSDIDSFEKWAARRRQPVWIKLISTTDVFADVQPARMPNLAGRRFVRSARRPGSARLRRCSTCLAHAPPGARAKRACLGRIEPSHCTIA
jgi:hypothetical protein